MIKELGTCRWCGLAIEYRVNWPDCALGSWHVAEGDHHEYSVEDYCENNTAATHVFTFWQVIIEHEIIVL